MVFPPDVVVEGDEALDGVPDHGDDVGLEARYDGRVVDVVEEPGEVRGTGTQVVNLVDKIILKKNHKTKDCIQ